MLAKDKTYRDVPVDAYNRFLKSLTRPVGEAIGDAMEKFLKKPTPPSPLLVQSVRADRTIRKIPLETHLRFVAYCAQHQLQVGLVLGQAMKNYTK